MLTVLQEKVAERLEMYLNPYKIIPDLEIAVINSIGGVLGNGNTIKCCFFHLCQSTLCKLQELKLKYLYNLKFKLFMGLLDGLSFLPLDQIMQGMEHLRNVQSPQAQPLTEYICSWYSYE